MHLDSEVGVGKRNKTLEEQKKGRSLGMSEENLNLK